MTIDPSQTATTQSGTRVSLGITQSDRSILRRSIAMIQSARADAKSENPAVAGQASQRLANGLCFVAGFLDGKAGGRVGVNPGFQGIAESSLMSNPDAQLDKCLQQLQELVKPGTRGPIESVILIEIGVALVVAGIVIKEAFGDG